jgi:hypothetical protein
VLCAAFFQWQLETPNASPCHRSRGWSTYRSRPLWRSWRGSHGSALAAAGRRGARQSSPSRLAPRLPLQLLQPGVVADPRSADEHGAMARSTAVGGLLPVGSGVVWRCASPCSTAHADPVLGSPAPTTGDLPLASAQQHPRPPPAPCSAPDPVAILAPPQALPGHSCSSERAGGVDLARSCGGFGRVGSRLVSLWHWGTGHPRRLVV